MVFWIGYGLVGHRLIEAAYKSESIAVVNKIMAGRESTPVQDYYARADQLLIQTSGKALLLIAALSFLISAIKKPLEMLLACASFIIFSFLLFSLFEVFPSLVVPLKLDKLGYYNAKLSKIPDETLGFRYTPGMRFIIHGNRSALYSPSYGVEVQPRTIEWVTNNDGFRGESENEVSDIVLLGDSFIDYGDNEAQTFGKILEQQLDGRPVTNLGISGYTPFHYLEVLKRYGLKRKPKVVFFCFYEGNDQRYPRISELAKRHDGRLGWLRVNIKNFYPEVQSTGRRDRGNDQGVSVRGGRAHSESDHSSRVYPS